MGSMAVQKDIVLVPAEVARPFELSKLERIRDMVKRFRGRLVITVYPATGRDYYRIEYSTDRDKAAYMRYTACEGDQRETTEEFWPSRMYDVLNTPGVVACVEFEGRDAEWFDASKDSTAIERMFRYVTTANPLEVTPQKQ